MRDCAKIIILVRRKEHLDSGSISPRLIQYCGGRRIKKAINNRRLGAIQSGVQQDPRSMGPKVNLFASSWNAQLPTFVSRFPQPGAWMTDAFSLNWKFVREYAPPPLQHHRRMPGQGDPGPSDSCVMVTPFWPSQTWLPVLLELSIDVPRMFFPGPDLLTSPLGERHQLITSQSLRLIAWRLSGFVSLARAFLETSSVCCFQPHAKIPTRPINQHGATGVIGATQDKSIPYRVV